MPANLGDDGQEEDDGFGEDAEAKAARLQREKEEAEREKRKLASLVIQRNYDWEESNGYFGAMTRNKEEARKIKVGLPMVARPEQVRLLDSSGRPVPLLWVG